VRIAAEAAAVERLQVVGLEDHTDEPGPHGLADGQWVSLADALEICKEMLREGGIWCKLENDDKFYVHVGYDYYMYVGTGIDVHSHWAELEAQGLFVDPDWSSPYSDED
jgi:hypothetical protein